MRRPARLERAGALTPRDRMWAAIRGFGSAGGVWFSVAEIMVLSDQRADTVLTYMVGLGKAGYIADAMEARTLPLLARRELRRYRLVRDVGVEAPRVTADGKPVTQGIGRDQMWRAMRVLKTFDWRELVLAASTERHPVAKDEAKTYLKFLARAGYLVVTRAARGGAAAARYRFVRARDTGPRAPLVTADKSVMDGNTGELVFVPAGARAPGGQP